MPGGSVRRLLVLALSAATLCAADVTGRWTATAGEKGRAAKITLNLRQTGLEVTGAFSPEGRMIDIRDGKVTGDRFEFDIETAAVPVKPFIA